MQALEELLPLSGLYSPAAQGEHALEEELPLLGLNVPAEQDVHVLAEVLPSLGTPYLPAAQGLQEEAPIEDQVPCAAGQV